MNAETGQGPQGQPDPGKGHEPEESRPGSNAERHYTWAQTVGPRRSDEWLETRDSGAFLEAVGRAALEQDDEVGEIETVFERLRRMARYERKGGRSLSECLEEVAALGDLLYEELWTEIDDLEPPPSPRSVFEMCRGLSRRLQEVEEDCAVAYLEEVETELEGERETFVEFSHVVKHELKDTLGSAFSAARLLQELGGDLPETSRSDVLGSIPRNVRRALNLLEGVRAIFASPGRDREPTSVRPLEDVVRETMYDLSYDAVSAGVSVDVPQEIPRAWVDADRARLILHNLMGNAIKYADPAKDEGWVQIAVSVHEGPEGEDREGGGGGEGDEGGEGGESGEGDEGGEGGEGREWVRIRVEDNGIGIRPEEREKIFERFYRSETSMASGSGLGLSIARGAARQLGGEITLESQPGRGSTFFVSIPTAEPPVEEIAPE